MPFDEGTVVEMTRLFDTGGIVDDEAALVSTGWDEVEVGGEQELLWRVDLYAGGRLSATFWMDAVRHLRLSDWKGAMLSPTPSPRYSTGSPRTWSCSPPGPRLASLTGRTLAVQPQVHSRHGPFTLSSLSPRRSMDEVRACIPRSRFRKPDSPGAARRRSWRRGDDEDNGPPLVQGDQEQGAEAEQADPEALPESGDEEIIDRASNSPGDPA